jgi:RHS repeat-associated protein
VDTLNPTGYAQVLDELQSNAVARSYTWGLQLVSESQLVAATPPANPWQTSWYGFDGHGSVRYLTSSTGAVTDTYDYDAFGNLINSTGSTANNYLFAGEQFDPNLGLYYNRARYLDVQLGRFWGMDTYEGSSSDPTSLHKYLYTGNDPVNHVDPSGNDMVDMMGAMAVAGIVTAISVQIVAAVGLTTTMLCNLPKDAFLKQPSGQLLGFAMSAPLGKIVGAVKTPFMLGLALGLQFSSVGGAVDFVMPNSHPQSPWVYWDMGYNVGVSSNGTNDLEFGANSPIDLNGTRFSAAYYGKVYNVNSPDDYNGSFFCSSGSFGGFVGLPVGPNVTVCSSPSGAYMWTVSPFATAGWAVGAAYSYSVYLGEINKEEE